MKLLTIAVVLSTILIGGCATTQTSSQAISFAKPELAMSQKEQWLLMVGKWYGDQPIKEGGRKQWIVERFPNGTYKIVFREITREGVTNDSAEVGQWGVSGPVYFSSFRGWVEGDKIQPSDPSDPYNYDAYRIIQLNSELFDYEHFSTGNRHTVKRVPTDFRMP